MRALKYAKERSAWPVGGPMWGTHWLLTGKGSPGGTSCAWRCLPVSLRAALWAKQLQQPLGLGPESVCVNACGRRIKPSATSEGVPSALLHSVGWGWTCSLLLAGAQCWIFLLWPLESYLLCTLRLGIFHGTPMSPSTPEKFSQTFGGLDSYSFQRQSSGISLQRNWSVPVPQKSLSVKGTSFDRWQLKSLKKLISVVTPGRQRSSNLC